MTAAQLGLGLQEVGHQQHGNLFNIQQPFFTLNIACRDEAAQADPYLTSRKHDQAFHIAGIRDWAYDHLPFPDSHAVKACPAEPKNHELEAFRISRLR